MIVVHGFAPMPPLPSPSPFCIKLETWLRMAQFAYQARADFSPLRAPKGKAPYATLEDGSTVADTHLIIRTLSKRPAVTLDRWLGARERATTTLIQRTVEDHLYFVVLHQRWVVPEGFRIVRRTYFNHLGAPARWVVPYLARRNVRAAVRYHGISRHTQDEIVAFAVEDFDALVQVLGDRPYFCGDRPSTADAIAYGGLAAIHLSPFPGPLQEAMRARSTLVRFVERMRERYWP
jgi:glutathione S-transferase